MLTPIAKSSAELDVQLDTAQAVIGEVRELADVVHHRSFMSSSEDAIWASEAQLARVADLSARMYRVKKTVRAAYRALNKLRQAARDEYSNAVALANLDDEHKVFPIALDCDSIDALMPDGTTYERQYLYMIADAELALENININK
jgi:hypothetical protein